MGKTEKTVFVPFVYFDVRQKKKKEERFGGLRKIVYFCTKEYKNGKRYPKGFSKGTVYRFI